MATIWNSTQFYWGIFQWETALLVFVAYVVIDMLYAKYTLSVAELHPSRAATNGALMYFLLAIGVLNYSHNPLYLVPLVLGSWIGTYVAVEIERRKRKKSKK